MKKEHLHEVSQDLAGAARTTQDEAPAALLMIVREIPDTELEHVTGGVDPEDPPCLICPPQH